MDSKSEDVTGLGEKLSGTVSSGFLCAASAKIRRIPPYHPGSDGVSGKRSGGSDRDCTCSAEKRFSFSAIISTEVFYE